MNALRMLAKLDAARERFQAEVERILSEAGAEQAAVRRAIADTALGGEVRGKQIKKRAGGAKKGYKYKAGLHWTQRPENKAKVLRMIRKGQRSKAA